MNKAITLELAGLTTRIVGPDDATTTIVLLHGFGAPGYDLVPLAEELALPRARFVFPEAPLDLGGMFGDSRAWWMIDIAGIEADLRSGRARSRKAEIPEGLEQVRAQLGDMLDALVAKYAIPPDRLVLGGFSQGAMLSVDVALHRSPPPAALVLLSGTLLAEPVWLPRMNALAGVPVLMSHGRGDPLLPFGVAEELRDALMAAGAGVEWHAFGGGHEIPRAVLAAARSFLQKLGA